MLHSLHLAKAVNDSLMEVVGTEGEIVMENVIDVSLCMSSQMKLARLIPVIR